MTQTLPAALQNPRKRKWSITIAALFFAPSAFLSSLTVLAAPPGPARAPTPTPHAVCQFRVLIVYADSGAQQPTAIRSEILADPDVTGVDSLEASTVTPTLAQLQQYG